MTFSMMYAYTRELRPAALARRGRARQGLAAGQDARRPLAAARQRCARCYAYMWAHPGKQLLFMGGEFGQGAEWAEAAVAGLVAARRPPTTAASQRLVRDLNRVYRDTPALWTQDTDAGRLPLDRRQRRRRQRRSRSCAAAPTARRWPASPTSPAVPHEGYRLGLPVRRALGARSSTPTPTIYGGSGVGNLGAVEAVDEPWHGQPASAPLRVPPLGALWLRYTGERD